MNIQNFSSALLIISFALGMNAQVLADNVSGDASKPEQSKQMDEPGHGRGGRPPGPPPEAIEACQGKAAGDTCSFEDREGLALAGKCFAPPARRTDASSSQTTKSANASDALTPPVACRPDRGPRRSETPAPDETRG